MKHQVLFSRKNNEKIFMNVVIYAVVIGALRVQMGNDSLKFLLGPAIDGQTSTETAAELLVA